jgi:ribonuclease HI
MDIIVYTDGSTLNNQHKDKRRGGIGVYFGVDDSRNQSIPMSADKISNQVAELSACIKAIEVAQPFNSLMICTDSMYTINCITKWCSGWEKKGWRKSDGKIIENLELVKKLYSYSNEYKIKYRHVRAHKNKPEPSSPDYNDWYGNMMADMLATNASKSF